MSQQPLISVVITGYRRPEQLRITVESFRRVNRYPKVELVLADDASPPEMQEEMRRLPIDRFLFAPRNRGLGANTNAGLAAARGDYVLQLQDDWLCNGPGDFLQAGLEVMRARPDIGMVRLHDRDPSLDFERVELAGRRVKIYRHAPGTRQFVYSDNPHLKSRAFIDFIGPFVESRDMYRCEFEMRDRFNAQSRFLAAFVEGYALFEHIGEEVSHRGLKPLARIGRFMDGVPGLDRLARLYRRLRYGAPLAAGDGRTP